MTIAPRFANPEGVHPPLGPYSHTVTADGSFGDTMAAQADQAFANVVALLAAYGLGVSSIVKLTVFIVAGHGGDEVRAARLKHLGHHEPTSTTVYVSQLVRPEWLVEVEAIAARM